MVICDFCSREYNTDVAVTFIEPPVAQKFLHKKALAKIGVCLSCYQALSDAVTKKNIDPDKKVK